MLSNRIIESCLVEITMLLAFATLRPIFAPDVARRNTITSINSPKWGKTIRRPRSRTSLRSGWSPWACRSITSLRAHLVFCCSGDSWACR